MKRFVLAALAASAVSAAALPAAAAPWQPINQRQARLDARIDMGVRNGALTKVEAVRLRSQFRTIAALEASYRRTGGGLSQWERTDLDRRMDVLSAKIWINKHDRQDRR